VRGIRLRADDEVVGMVVADPEASLLTGTETGHGKRTPVDQYPIKGRGGYGVIDIRATARNGRVVGVGLCRDGDDVMFITGSGMMVRTPCADLSVMGRNTQGVRLVNLKAGDSLVALDVVSESDLERYALPEASPGPETDSGAEEAPEEAPEEAGEEAGE
jgi:DNA gyrase subunit A